MPDSAATGGSEQKRKETEGGDANGAFSRRSFLKAGGALGITLAYFAGADLWLRSEREVPNRSFWRLTLPDPPRYEPLRARRRVDIAIIGGGYTGLSTAYHAKKRWPDANVLLLEARYLGYGASGRNGGQLGEWTTGGEHLPGYFQFLESLIKTESLSCDILGHQLDPYKLVVELGRRVSQLGVDIHEESAAVRIDEGKTVRIIGKSFEVEANRLVLATNAYTPKLGYFERELVPVHTGVVMTSPSTDVPATKLGAFIDLIRGGPNFYWGRVFPNGRVLFGGGVRYTYNNGLDFSGCQSLYRALEAAMHSRFPFTRSSRTEYRWNGPVASFADQNPRLGVVGEHQNIYYGLGYAGEGVTTAIRFGAYIVGMMDHEPPPRWTLRRPLWLPGEPLRYMGVNAAIHLVDFGLVPG